MKLKQERLLITFSDRLDLIVKKRLFDELRWGMEPDFSFYKEMILARTGGKELAFGKDKGKSKIEDYIASVYSLFESMKSGFKGTIPVKNGVLLNGSHRLACAMSLGIEPVFEETEYPSVPDPWDFTWFERFPEKKMFLLHGYANLYPCSIYVLWGAYKDRWGEFDIPHVVGSVSFRLPSAETIRDVYKSNVSKADRLFQTPDVKVIVCKEHDTRPVKEKCRELVGDQKFMSVHASNDLKEARHIANTLLSENNLRLYKSRKPLSKITAERIRFFGSDMCIVGGMVREMFTDHVANDIDAIGTCQGVDLIRNYRTRYTDEQILEHPDLHFYVRGVKFCNPEIEALKKRQA